MFRIEHLEDERLIESQNMRDVFKIFAEHGEFLMSVLTSKFSPQPDVDLEDLFQDFFVSLSQKPIPSDVKCIKSYLYKAINNDIKDQYRKSRTYRNHRSNHQHFRRISHLARLEEPASQIEHKDLLHHIDQKISLHLPAHEANAVKEKLFFGNSIAEGADNLNIQKRSFSRYLSIGLRRLRNLMPDLENTY